MRNGRIAHGCLADRRPVFQEAARRPPDGGAEIVATILAESGDIKRFPGPGEYSAFCGLDPSVRDSDARIVNLAERLNETR